jgi:polyhydroxyalkanoate synthesis regulator phasin
MTETTGTSKENVKAESKETMFPFARKFVLAAIGAAVIAEDELEQCIAKLAEKGELAEEDARKLIKEMIEAHDKLLKEHRAERTKIHHSNITQEELDSLNARVSELTRQIDDLKKQQKS